MLHCCNVYNLGYIYIYTLPEYTGNLQTLIAMRASARHEQEPPLTLWCDKVAQQMNGDVSAV